MAVLSRELMRSMFLFVQLRGKTLPRQRFSSDLRTSYRDIFRTGIKRIRCFQSILCVANKEGDSENYFNKIKAYCSQKHNKTDVAYF